jgi:site-specific DNA recombinase
VIDFSVAADGMTTRAISWAAVSSKPQADRESLHDQHRLNHALAEALGWEIVEDITVPGESRSYHRLSEATANLEAYQRLTEHAEGGHISWLIVKSRDRLARTRRLNREVADYLQDHNIRVYSRTMPPANTEQRTESDVWGEAIESGYSEAEILRLKQRREMGMQARVRAGKIPGTPPWGFRRIADERGNVSHVFADPRAEEAVRFAITRYQAGISLLRIVAEARKKGIKTARGQESGMGTVRQTVFQPAYYSLAAWGKRRTSRKNGKKHTTRVPIEDWLIAEGNFDAPFTPDDWRATVEEFRRRATEHPRRRGTKYPLSGILWCGHCGRPMSGSNNKGRRYYRCGHNFDAENRIPSKRHHIRVPKAHLQLGEHLRHLMLQADWLSALSEHQPEGPDQSERALLLEQGDALARRRRPFTDGYEAGATKLADFSDGITQIDREEAALDKRIARLDNELVHPQAREDWLTLVQERIVALPDTLSSDLSPTDADKLRKVATVLWKRIIVEDRRVVRAEWRSP